MISGMTKTAKTKFIQKYDWTQDILPYLDNMEAVAGGYTSVRRGVVMLADGVRVFIKIASAQKTIKWLKKEVKAYQILNQAGYPYIPQLLSFDQENTSMAIEYMDGASFESTWDGDKLQAMLVIQEELKKYKRYFINDPDFTLESVVNRTVKWPIILAPGNLEVVNVKLTKLGINLVLTKEQISGLQSMHRGWSMHEDTLVHQDLRADNFGYYNKTKSGKLIDWNWLCIGDESLDRTPLFVNMYISGFDPYKLDPEAYDAKMLAYLVSFWLDQILMGDEDSNSLEFSRRKAQAKSVKACIELLNRGH